MHYLLNVVEQVGALTVVVRPIFKTTRTLNKAYLPLNFEESIKTAFFFIIISLELF